MISAFVVYAGIRRFNIVDKADIQIYLYRDYDNMFYILASLENNNSTIAVYIYYI